MVLSAAGVDANRPLDEQADAFWWNAQSDAALDAALTRAADAEWRAVVRLVRGAGPATDGGSDDSRVLTVTRDRPAVVALDPAGAMLERIEPQGSTIFTCGRRTSSAALSTPFSTSSRSILKSP